MVSPAQRSIGAPIATAKPLVLRGLYPATVTPFAKDLSIDWTALENHLTEIVSAEGVRGIVVNGGVAEVLQLELKEQTEVIRLALRLRREGQLVIAGIEGRGPRQAVAAARAAKSAGADALLVLPPFDARAYKRLSQDRASVVGFFETLDREVDIPLIVFQYPPQTDIAYPVEVLAEAAEIRNVVAIKAASARADVYAALWDALHKKISVLAAVDSPPLYDMLLHGSHGALIGISSIAPQKWAELLVMVKSGDHAGARARFDSFCRPLMASIFQNQQPVRLTSEAAAMKEAMVLLGQLPSSRVRPPAIDVDAKVREEIRRSLVEAGLL